MINESQIDATVKQMFADIRFTQEPRGLYDPLRYMIEIGGKRVRPRLCLTAYSLFADTIDENILSPAKALEVFHSFTLMHDDIMDRSPLRRGMPTVWKKWNEDTAILSGDVMLIESYKLVAGAPHNVMKRVMSLFSKTSAEVCDGQQYDMDFESVDEVSMEDYDKMIGLKTAVLLACSSEMGAIIGGATDAECKALYNYGYELGMAFQVADDYLDAFGDEKIFGKPIGGDILNCKKSWLTVRTMEKASDKEAFLEAFRLPSGTREQREYKIQYVKGIYMKYGVDEDAKNEIVRFSGRALEAVKDVGFSAEKLDRLHNFAEQLVGRAK